MQEMENTKLKKQIASLERKNSNTDTAEPAKQLDTPRREAQNLINRMNEISTPERLEEIAPLLETVSAVRKASPKTKRSLFTSQKKRRGLKNKIAKTVKMSNENVYGGKKKGRGTKSRGHQQKARREAIKAFLERQDNSYELPDQKNTHRFALSDTLRNLYRKYVGENPTSKVSYATFARARAFYNRKFKRVDYLNRDVCLCVSHANIHLLLDAAKVFEKSSAALAKLTDEQVDAKLDLIQTDFVSYQIWERKELLHKENLIQKTELFKMTETKEEFRKVFKKKLEEFRPHQQRVEDIFNVQKTLKQNLADNDVIVYLDYSENWVTVYKREISEQFFNNKQMTFLPFVLYYKEDTQLKHKSFALITEETSHMASTTIVGIIRLLRYIKQIKPELRRVFFISDSPGSQFRNKTVAFFMSQFCILNKDIEGVWVWMEAGHGKSPCDGVGGALKKAATNAVKANIIMRNATEFEAEMSKRGLKTKIMYSKQSVVKSVQEEVDGWKEPKVVGISDFHCTIGRGLDSLFSHMPCFKVCCYSNGNLITTCDSWFTKYRNVDERPPFTIPPIPHTPSTRNLRGDEEMEVGDNTVKITNKDVGKWVAFKCGEEYEIGEIVKIIDSFIQVKVLEKGKRINKYKSASKLNITSADMFLCFVKKPTKKSRGGMLEISKADRMAISAALL